VAPILLIFLRIKLTRVYACHTAFLTGGVYTPYSPCMSKPLITVSDSQQPADSYNWTCWKGCSSSSSINTSNRTGRQASDKVSSITRMHWYYSAHQFTHVPSFRGSSSSTSSSTSSSSYWYTESFPHSSDHLHFLSLQPDTSLHCKTMDMGYCITQCVRLQPNFHQYSVPTHRGMARLSWPG